MTNSDRLRWFAVCVFALSNALNFLDRQILSALAPEILKEFSLTLADYGDVTLVFSIAYALSAPLAGLLIDRIGLNRGASLAVAVWSTAGICTGFVQSLAGLMICRAALGIGEGGGIPGTGKVSATYLVPKERAFGSAISQVGLTIGGVAAPVLAETCSRLYGWRSAFIVAGALGFVWIPVWLYAARLAPKKGELTARPSTPIGEVLRAPSYWALLGANVLLMLVYSLWVVWTTVFLVRQHGLSQQAANYQLAWIPPVFATAGGFFGSWLTLRWASALGDVTRARMRVILLGCAFLLLNAAVPLMPSPGLATALICLSFFFCVSASVNIYALPLDLFGPGRAAFTVASLTCVYGLLQGGFSSVVGRVVESHGFFPVCLAAGVLPMGSWLLLRQALRRP
jgi:ACS family hexuronate transporter-like MFS transporter